MNATQCIFRHQWLLAAWLGISFSLSDECINAADSGTKGNTYSGKVGKLKAVYEIHWKKDGSVSGTYSYPTRPGVVYRLVGNNHEEGKLYLEEFTGAKLSARCYLSKRVTDDRVVWEGQMKNTDGRVHAMTMQRGRSNQTQMPRPEKVKIPDYFSLVPETVVWGEPPKANLAVSRATCWYDDATYTEAEVVDFSTNATSTSVAMTLGVYVEQDDRHKFEHTGPTVTVTFPRVIPIKRDWIQGKRISLEITGKGRIRGINLTAIAVTHYRKAPSGKLEVRGILETDAMYHAKDLNQKSMEELLDYYPSIDFVPDKIALPGKMPEGWKPDLMFQTLRITEEFGTAIQVLEAGPGVLELESMSLDIPGGEIPWIPIGREDARSAAPLTQRTTEAG